MVIGIIGKIGSGKSLCVKIANEEYNAIIYSCDDIAKEMIESKEVDYKIDNPVQFFTDEKLQEKCRQKVHIPVFNKINSLISEDKKRNIVNNREKDKTYVIESALPSELFIEMCDKVIYIECSLEKVANLLSLNRDYNFGKTKLIYDSQKYYEKFYEKADYKIVNDGTEEELISKFREVMNEICVIRK